MLLKEHTCIFCICFTPPLGWKWRSWRESFFGKEIQVKGHAERKQTKGWVKGEEQICLQHPRHVKPAPWGPRSLNPTLIIIIHVTLSHEMSLTVAGTDAMSSTWLPHFNWLSFSFPLRYMLLIYLLKAYSPVNLGLSLRYQFITSLIQIWSETAFGVLSNYTDISKMIQST